MFRIGIGNDTHKLVEGRPLMLGGVLVASERGGEGHSDADALLHAIAMPFWEPLRGDLECTFQIAIRSGRTRAVCSCCHAWFGWPRTQHSIVNVDSTIMLETPKLRPYVPAMREKIAEVWASRFRA